MTGNPHTFDIHGRVAPHNTSHPANQLGILETIVSEKV